MSSEHNWASNYIFTAARFHRPHSIDEVRRLVAGAPKVRAIGSRHSFNDIADSTGDVVDLGGIDPDIVIDRERMTVTVGANTIYSVLAADLQAAGYALHNMASLPHITLIGAVVTGTHGSGDRNGALGTAVAGLEMITAGGDLVRVERGQEGFDGMVVGLGAFGIVSRMTLDIQPSFFVQQDAFVDLPWSTAIDDFDAVSSAAYSVSLFTRWSAPTIERLWLKSRLEDAKPLQVTATHLGATAAPVPMITRAGEDVSKRAYPFGGLPGLWLERLPHFRHDVALDDLAHIQSEYILPRGQASEAFKRLRAFGERIDAHLQTAEIRTVAADDLWLSPSYGNDAVCIHFTWQHKPAEVDAITREVEATLLPLGGRPHWGKVLHARAAELAPLYPRMDAFRALAERWDPTGKFRNAYLTRHVFG